MNEFLQSQFQDIDFQANSFRVYTTLDLDLQRAAAEAIREGMQGVDEQIRKQKRFKGQPIPEAQCALIALDPHTGEIKALAGGRNYGVSQLNHILAKRQPGSIFKPFVYTAALNTASRAGRTSSPPAPRCWMSRPLSGTTTSLMNPAISSTSFTVRSPSARRWRTL